MFVLSNQHVQDYGVRKWAGDDLIELQSEPLSALQALVAPYAPCILTGCELETVPDGNGEGSPAYRLHAGYVALKGRKTVENSAGTGTDGTDAGADGTDTGSGVETAAVTAENGDTAASQDEEYVKIVRVEAQTVHQPTVFLTLACTPVSRAYGNGENKAIAYDYTAEVCDVLSKVGDRPYLALAADADNPRLPDTLGVTKKLNSVDGEAKDVVVTFTEDAGKDAPEDLQSGLTLGVLISRIKKWLGKKLNSVDGEAKDVVVTFTETVAETDSVPDRPELKSGSRLGLLMRQIRKWFDELKDLKGLAFKDKVAKTDLDADLQGELDGKALSVHPHDVATTSLDGLMSATDKLKLDGIADGATKVLVDSVLSSSSKNPVQNQVVNAALASKADSGHRHSWDSVTDKPSIALSGHTHAPSDIGAAPASHSHSWDSVTGKPSIALSGHTHAPSDIGAASTAVASTTAAGLMSAADKSKLDGFVRGFRVTVTGFGNLRLIWTRTTASGDVEVYADLSGKAL